MNSIDQTDQAAEEPCDNQSNSVRGETDEEFALRLLHDYEQMRDYDRPINHEEYITALRASIQDIKDQLKDGFTLPGLTEELTKKEISARLDIADKYEKMIQFLKLLKNGDEHVARIVSGQGAIELHDNFVDINLKAIQIIDENILAINVEGGNQADLYLKLQNK